MRSRYTAFTTGDVEYLWRTLDSSHVDRARPRDEVLRSLRDTCRRVRFLRLRVLDDAPADEEGFARVLFCVRAFEKGRERSFHELSRFRHDGQGWRYVDGKPVDGAAPDGYTIRTFRGG
jgi:SEC-C motif-containing protein